MRPSARFAGMGWRLIAAILLLAALAPASAAQTSDERLAAVEGAVRDDAARRGAKVFRQACAACHGRDGRGDGPAAAELDPRPRDLTVNHYRFRTTANGQQPRAEDLLRTVHDGLPGTSMPAFGNLFSQEELDDLVAFLGSLQPSGAWAAPEPLALGALPEGSTAALDDGRALYLFVGCWRCHGLEGRGNGPSSGTLTDDRGNPIRATDFRYDPFKGGHEPLDVVRALRTGLNGTPMPSYDEAMMLTRADAAAVPSLEGQLDAADTRRVADFAARAPTSEALAAMAPAERDELRDRRIGALARYVLSLSRRRGALYWLFHEEPEKEARK